MDRTAPTSHLTSPPSHPLSLLPSLPPSPPLSLLPSGPPGGNRRVWAALQPLLSARSRPSLSCSPPQALTTGPECPCGSRGLLHWCESEQMCSCAAASPCTASSPCFPLLPIPFYNREFSLGPPLQGCDPAPWLPVSLTLTAMWSVPGAGEGGRGGGTAGRRTGPGVCLAVSSWPGDFPRDRHRHRHHWWDVADL